MLFSTGGHIADPFRNVGSNRRSTSTPLKPACLPRTVRLRFGGYIKDSQGYPEDWHNTGTTFEIVIETHLLSPLTGNDQMMFEKGDMA